MNKKFNYILEIVWLVVAIISLAAYINKTISSGFNQSYPFLIILTVSIFIYLLKRKIRLQD